MQKFMMGSSVLCILSYLAAVFSPYPIFALIGCGADPGLVSMVSKAQPSYSLKAELFCAIIFPVLMILVILYQKRELATDTINTMFSKEEQNHA